MQAIRQTQQLNKHELENATPPSASWHADYRDTAWVYVGGIPLDLSEGDVVTIFSQFGNPTHLNLIRDRETGKSKGFGFLKYEDQRSCDLAVDNLSGAEVLGRMLRVDHTRYKKRDDEDEDTWRIDRLEAEANGNNDKKRASDTEESEDEKRRIKRSKPLLKEEEELEKMLAIRRNGEDEDPMKDYLVKEKREEARKARDREDDRERGHKHRHRHRDEDDKIRRERRDRRRDDRKEHDNVQRDRKNQRKGRESVDSDGDVVERPIQRDVDREVQPRSRSRDRKDRGARVRRSRQMSRSDSSSQERRGTSRREEDRPRRRRSKSQDHPISRRKHGSDGEDNDRRRSSGKDRSRREDR